MRLLKTQVICLANQIGGCGKTSSAVSMGAAFATLGYSVCLVDADPLCNLSMSFGINCDNLYREGKCTLADAFLKKKPAVEIKQDFEGRFPALLSLVPGNHGLSSSSVKLEAQLQGLIAGNEISSMDADDHRNEHRLRLRKSIESLRGVYDIVLIDTAPNLDFVMTAALVASDWFIIPVFPSGYDLSGLELLLRTVERVRARFNPELRLAGVLLGNYDRNTKLDCQIHDLLKKQFTEQSVFQTTIGRSVRYREATFGMVTVFEMPEAAPQAEQYLALVKEMINRGAKGIVGQTANPLPSVADLSRLAAQEEVQGVVNG